MTFARAHEILLTIAIDIDHHGRFVIGHIDDGVLLPHLGASLVFAWVAIPPALGAWEAQHDRVDELVAIDIVAVHHEILRVLDRFERFTCIELGARLIVGAPVDPWSHDHFTMTIVIQIRRGAAFRMKLTR